MIKKIFMLLLIMIMCVVLPDFLALASNVKPPKEGKALPLIQLPAPETSEERNYLGIEGEDFFTIPTIKANIVVVYFFSLYCRFCTKQVELVNELYRVIDKNPDAKKKIKLIGIGIGNTPMEVDEYKEMYRVPFPLIPDTDFSVHKACGEIVTPYFFVVRIDEDGMQMIICSTYAFSDANEFLKLIMKKSKLPKQE